jgi:energy-coupling factor transport system permease protein
MIELSRDITFGQYINNGSPLTRMDPRAKLISAFFLIALALFIDRFIAFAVCLLICIVIQWQSHISTPYVLGSFKPFLGFLAFIYVIEVLFYYAPNQHQTILWHWRIISISSEALYTSAIAMARFLLLYYFVLMLLFTTSLVDQTDGMEVLFSPLQKIGLPVNAFIMVYIIAMKFVPIFVAEIERLIKAQAARGVRFDKGNLVQRTRKIAPILVPLFVSGFKRAQTLSVAMEARCYGGRPGWHRSKRRELRFAHYDIQTLIFTIVSCAVVAITNFYAPF